MAHLQLQRAETWHSGVELREQPMSSIEDQAPAAPGKQAPSLSHDLIADHGVPPSRP
ncbi:hypothetical protein AUP68_14745 [Ilyonectria robusta]